jgi:hypothetical protein
MINIDILNTEEYVRIHSLHVSKNKLYMKSILKKVTINDNTLNLRRAFLIYNFIGKV